MPKAHYGYDAAMVIGGRFVVADYRLLPGNHNRSSLVEYRAAMAREKRPESECTCH